MSMSLPFPFPATAAASAEENDKERLLERRLQLERELQVIEAKQQQIREQRRRLGAMEQHVGQGRNPPPRDESIPVPRVNVSITSRNGQNGSNGTNRTNGTNGGKQWVQPEHNRAFRPVTRLARTSSGDSVVARMQSPEMPGFRYSTGVDDPE